MIGEIPKHIGSKLGAPEEETVQEESKVAETSAEVVSADSPEETSPVITKVEKKESESTDRKPKKAPLRAKKSPKKIKKRTPAGNSSTEKPAPQKAEITSEAKEPQVEPKSVEKPNEPIAQPKEKSVPNQVSSSDTQIVKTKQTNGQKKTVKKTVAKIKTEDKDSYRVKLKEQEERSKVERKEYLINLSKQTQSFLDDIRAKRRALHQNSSSNAANKN